MRVEILQFNFETMLGMIREGEKFAFSRFGDGEWACVFGEDGGNCDGHEYFKDLGKRLAEVLKSRPDYYMGMQPKAMRDMGKRIREWLIENRAGREWCDADILHEASMAGKLDKFWDVLKGRRACMVSSYHMSEMGNFPVRMKSVNIPGVNSWLKYDDVKAACCRLIEQDKPDVFLFCAGMMSKVLIHELYEEYGNKVTLLDCGSVFDPMVGRCTRNYHAKIIAKAMEGKK